jgi:hypothetical protein
MVDETPLPHPFASFHDEPAPHSPTDIPRTSGE